eukprot:scaffold18274_cov15-Phaeocystis_antarctica.AAC.1
MSGGGAGSIDGHANRRPQKSTIENFARVGFARPPVHWGVEYNNLETHTEYEVSISRGAACAAPLHHPLQHTSSICAD